MGMAASAHRRILVALQPTVLEGAFAALLGHGERSDVVQFHKASPEQLSGHYDVAVVTEGLAGDVETDILIVFADTETGGDVAIITVNGLPRIVRAASSQDVMDLFSEHFPGEFRPPDAQGNGRSNGNRLLKGPPAMPDRRQPNATANP